MDAIFSPIRALQIAAAMVPLITFAASAHADIFQWEYIDPADPSQGKQQSTTLAPDGAGVDAVPGADFSRRDMTMAYLNGSDLGDAVARGATLRNASLVGANLFGADFSIYSDAFDAYLSDLSGADFSYANLGNANLLNANLTDADLLGADVRGAKFGGCCWTVSTRLTLGQLYSTASYQARDLSGITLWSHRLAFADFAKQDLTNADFKAAYLTGADFSGAKIRGASFEVFSIGCCVPGSGISPEQLYSTVDYQQRDLSGINFTNNRLTGTNLAGQNLAGANFSGATLTDADFTDGHIRGANFSRLYYDGITGRFVPSITLAQLYSTASYRSGDLSGTIFSHNDFSGGDFAGMNLKGSIFNASVSNADFSAADLRGTSIELPASAITTNLIRPDGHIDGLNLVAGRLLVVSNYGGPITIDKNLTMGTEGTLRMVFEADAWDSTISFASGIPVTLGGTLELAFAAAVNPATQVGRTFDLFDWTGVTPTGAFAISSSYRWDLSDLYTTGKVTLTAVPEPTAVALATFALNGFALRQRQLLHRT